MNQQENTPRDAFFVTFALSLSLALILCVFGVSIVASIGVSALIATIVDCLVSNSGN